MRVALVDGDGGSFPNLALMKLSAYHKTRGDSVEWFGPLFEYNKIYASKVFTSSNGDDYLPDDAVRGGTGYSPQGPCLPDEAEHICPDYELYGENYSLGFLTRGCIRYCSWCIVPQKEGYIRPYADIEEFAKHRDVVLMDNNVLAHSHGIQQIEKMARLGLRVDFNQGLDARLIDDGIARRLAGLKWLNPLRLACDSADMIEHVRRAVELLRWHNVAPRRYSCYVLVRDVDDAVGRVRFLKGLNVDPFAQPFLDPGGSKPTSKQKHFARWCNHKAEYNSRTWKAYRDAQRDFFV